ncbi:30S ribosomal protein S20 [Bacillus thuringiensis]|uniref:30S ribosomal protein S20 n=1 Tax=Bacillus thuringiensis TaxID=1428 RepID=UPI000E314D41|nr:30S ribosomal protein S20 [Bacillus thuringiensis]
MANIKSAIKRAKLSEERRAHNASIKSDMRSAVKTVEENAKEAFKTASKKLDKAARKGLIHQNAAARQKSRLAKQVNA